MDLEIKDHVKIEVVDEMDVPSSSMESTTVAAMDLETKAHVKLEERCEMCVPPISMVGAFAEDVFPEWCPMSIKEEEDVSSTVHASNTKSATDGSTVSTVPLGCNYEAVGLKMHISAVLGELLDRDLNNVPESGFSPGGSAHLPSLSQPIPRLPQKVTARRSTPSSTSKSVSMGRPRRVFDTELARRVLHQLDSKPSPAGRALLQVAVGPADASEQQPYPCYYCECRFEQQSSRNTHLLHAHTKAVSSARGLRELGVLRRALQPQSCWSIGENHSLPRRTVLQNLHGELDTGLDNLTRIHICGVRVQQTVSQEDSSYGSAENEGLARDTACEFTCSSCQMSFLSKYSLIKHVFSHVEGVEPPSHVCRSCGKVFLTRVSLSNHLRMHEGDTAHAAVKLYKCHVCNKSFFETASLKAHERVHSGPKSHECHICSRSFGRAFDLKSHLLIHSGLKPHECHVCSKRFVTASLLKRHALIHSGMMPHRCQVCSKSFLTPSLLLRHALIHSGLKPHRCDACGKLFARTYDLKRHALIHSRMKPRMRHK